MLWQDLRYALRRLRRAPGFALTVTLTLALSIGASSAIFCLMDGLWLHPLRVPQPGRIVRVFSTTPQSQDGMFSYPDFQAFAERVTAFKGKGAGLVAIGDRGNLMARPDGTSTELPSGIISSNFFTVLGVRPLLGRLFTAADASLLRTHPGVVLGYRCWQRDFGGDPQIVGRQIPLRHGKNGIDRVDVWGVLPPSFRDVNPDSDRDLWITTDAWAALHGPGNLTSHLFRWFRMIGRLQPDATVQQADEQVTLVAGTLAAAYPEANHGRGARAIGDFNYRMSLAGTTGMILLAIVCGVVLLAIVNVAHLLHARALGRASEVALRLALGATRRAVARQLLVENLLLCVMSLAAALGVAAALSAVLPRLLVQEPAMLEPYRYPLHLQIDGRVFVFASLLALVTMLLLAFVPLRQTASVEVSPVLQANSSSSTGVRMPLLRRGSIWLQIGISFALLVSTGALVRSFLNTRSKPIGITRKQVLLLFTQEPEKAVRDQVVAKLRQLPGVEHVAYSIVSPLSLSDYGIAMKVQLPSHPELQYPFAINFNAVTPNYLDVIGTYIVKGRGFTPTDDSGPVAVIVNQAMARRYWPGLDPIGQVVRFAGVNLEAHVIGVAQDAAVRRIGELPEPYLYVPFQQYVTRLGDIGEMTFAVQTKRNAMTLAREGRQALIGVNPLLDPMTDTSLPELIRYSARNYQMVAELVSTLGLIGLALTVVGLYGFLAFRVAQRRREIGIRMALGASRNATTWLILRDTMRLAAVGLVVGVVLAIAAGHLESAALFGVRAMNALSVSVALVILSAGITVAAWLPARRAASIEPAEALRIE